VKLTSEIQSTNTAFTVVVTEVNGLKMFSPLRSC